MLPRLDGPITDAWRRRFRRVPAAMRIFRALLFWWLELQVFGFLGNLRMRKQGERMARRHLEKQIQDPKLRAALTPGYEFGCKRVLRRVVRP